MKVTRLEEAVKYSPPKHTATCHAMWLQHKSMGCEAPYWVGCSYYLPGAKAEWDASPLDKIYIVLEGSARLRVGSDEQAVRPGQVLFIRANAPHAFIDIREDLTLLAVFSVPEKPYGT